MISNFWKRASDKDNKPIIQSGHGSWWVIKNQKILFQGTTVGGELSDIGTIISHVKDKTRVGVCIDTCHAMAAG